MPRPAGRDLALLHGLQQRGLRLGRGAIDLVGQHHVGEDRSPGEDELLTLGVEDAAAGDVGRQQIRRELDAAELARHAAGQGLAHQGLAHPRHVLQQHVLAGQQRHHAQAHDVALAEHDLGDVLLQLPDQRTWLERHLALQPRLGAGKKRRARCPRPDESRPHGASPLS